MDKLPLEILDLIALAGGYHGLLCLRRFTYSLTSERRIDFMIEFGHTIEITRYRINWKRNGVKHRIDGPAVLMICGYKAWYVNGLRHRVDGPAVEDPAGSKSWYLDNSSSSRINEYLTGWIGYKAWYVNGLRHRIGKPAIEFANGTEKWYVDGERHRIGGPAIDEVNGDKIWYMGGLLHRVDGPAVMMRDGRQEWFINGVRREDCSTKNENFNILSIINEEHCD